MSPNLARKGLVRLMYSEKEGLQPENLRKKEWFLNQHSGYNHFGSHGCLCLHWDNHERLSLVFLCLLEDSWDNAKWGKDINELVIPV